MKKFVLFALLVVVLAGAAQAVSVTEISYFYSAACSHCHNVADSGIIDEVAGINGVSVNKFEVTSPVIKEKYLGYVDEFRIKNAGIPFVVIEQGNKSSYLMGDTQIIEGLKDIVLNFDGHEVLESGVDEGFSLQTIFIIVSVFAIFFLLLILSRRK